MRPKPSHFYIAGKKVLDQVRDQAPDDVKRSFAELMAALEPDPYPQPGRNYVAEMRVGIKHLYVAWTDLVHVSYRVAQDQPVILLVGVHWFGPPSGPDDGDQKDGDPWSGLQFGLAA